MRKTTSLVLCILVLICINKTCFSHGRHPYTFINYAITDSCEARGSIQISLINAGNDSSLIELNQLVVNRFINFLNEENKYKTENITGSENNIAKDCIDGHFYIHKNDAHFPLLSFHMDYIPMHELDHL